MQKRTQIIKQSPYMKYWRKLNQKKEEEELFV